MEGGVSMMKGKILVILYAALAFVLLLYSYTQVDLGLTLTRMNIWQSIQKSFQYIGYFQRPLSTGLYIGILCLYFVLYGVVLWMIRKKRMSLLTLWWIIAVTTVILVFSYPAFSYDLFNHMFTAKTVLVYHKNPYLVTPLQFAGIDPWLSFMHWTHVISIYSPLWIAVTMVPYLLGFGYFLLLMWNFKILTALGYILAAWGVSKILKTKGETNMMTGLAVFALNPLVIIESLVSAHNDIVMMGFAVYAIALFSEKRKLASWIALALSISTKLMTVCLIPAFAFRWNRKVALFCMTAGLLLFLLQREIMPWYLLWILPFVALMPEAPKLTLVATGISFGLLMRYAPFLYFGHWNDPVPALKAWGTWIPILSALLFIYAPSLVHLRKKPRNR